MCGIAGIIDLSDSPISKDILEDMSASLIHRGPDDEGIYTENNNNYSIYFINEWYIYYNIEIGINSYIY